MDVAISGGGPTEVAKADDAKGRVSKLTGKEESLGSECRGSWERGLCKTRLGIRVGTVEGTLFIFLERGKVSPNTTPDFTPGVKDLGKTVFGDVENFWVKGLEEPARRE